jgi:hypothetical protein
MMEETSRLLYERILLVVRCINVDRVFIIDTFSSCFTFTIDMIIVTGNDARQCQKLTDSILVTHDSNR